MKPFLIFSIIFGSLIIQNLASSPNPSSTEPVTTPSDSTIESHISTSGSPGSQSTQEPNQSTESNTGSTPEPQVFTGSTVAPVTQQPGGQTTVNSGAETTAAQNVPTTQADTWAEFDLDCNTTADYCVYTINAPQLSADAYNDENNKYQADKNEYLSASSKAYYDSASFYAGEVYQLYKDTKEKFDNLTRQMETLSDMINQAYEESQNQTGLIKQSLDDIKFIYSSLSNCYYQKCALATVPPPKTTTTQRTKPPNPCDLASVCDAPAPYPAGNCSLLFNGNPTCQCPGNLDQTKGCKSVGCNSLKDGLKDGTVPGPFWSPGFDGTNNVSYGSGLDCQYKISSSKAINVTVHSFKFHPNLSLTVNNRRVPNTITDVVKLKQFLDAAIASSKVLTVLFKTGDIVGGSYFINWDLS